LNFIIEYRWVPKNTKLNTISMTIAPSTVIFVLLVVVKWCSVQIGKKLRATKDRTLSGLEFISTMYINYCSGVKSKETLLCRGIEYSTQTMCGMRLTLITSCTCLWRVQIQTYSWASASGNLQLTRTARLRCSLPASALPYILRQPYIFLRNIVQTQILQLFAIYGSTWFYKIII
jgi:hypothetical protein